MIGQRGALADWLRLQLYGVMWQATGIDQDYPGQYTPRQSDFDEDTRWKGFTAAQPFSAADLAFDVLRAGAARVGDIPMLFINEPMFISTGQNSDLRYNFFYPRWAYDRYREQLRQLAAANGWQYWDAWDLVPAEEFTDSPVHMTPVGTGQFAAALAAEIIGLADRNR